MAAKRGPHQRGGGDAPEYTRQVPKFLRGLLEERKSSALAESDALEAAVIVDERGRPVAESGPAYEERREDWKLEYSERFKVHFYVNVKTGQRRFTKPDVLKSLREATLPSCAIVEVISKLQSRWFNLDAMEEFDQEPAALTQHRAALEAMSKFDEEQDVREAASECLKRLVIDLDGSLARLPPVPTTATAAAAAAPSTTSQPPTISTKTTTTTTTIKAVPEKRPAAPPITKTAAPTRNKSLLSFANDEEEEDDD